MAKSTLPGLLVLASLWSLGLGLYSHNGPVTIINERNFNEVVVMSNVVTVVEFYASWCEHCKKFAPTYEKVAENLKGLVQIAAVDCGEKENIAFCGHFDLSGYPTIKVYPVEKQRDPKTEIVDKEPMDYFGPKAAKPLADFAKSLIPDLVSSLTSLSEYNQFLGEHNGKKVILFTDKTQAPVMFKSFSARFHEDVKFGLVSSTTEEVVKEAGVESFPKILYYKEGKESLVYDGEMTTVSLLEFMEHWVYGPARKKGEMIQEISISDIERIAEDDEDNIWLVGFYGENGKEGCDEALVEFSSLMKDVKLAIEVASSKIQKNETHAAAKYCANPEKLNSDPCSLQLVRFASGEDKNEDEECQLYEGEMDKKSVQGFAYETLPDLAVELNAKTMDFFLDGSLGPRGANPLLTPKIILFTAKSGCPSLYKALAFKFRKWNFAFGFYPNPEEEVLEKLPFKKPPVLIALQVDTAAAEAEQAKTGQKVQLPFKIQAYPAAMKFDLMVGWVEYLGRMWGSAPDSDEDAHMGTKAEALAELTEQETMKWQCGKVGICLVALMSSKSEDLLDQLKILEGIAQKRAADPIGFFWVDAHSRGKLLEGFSVVRSDIPTVVAFSSGKMRFVAMRDTFTQEHVEDFINGVLIGQVKTAPIQAVPSFEISDEVVPEGTTAEEEIMEEEIDLSEIMSEEVKLEETKEDMLKRIDEEIEAEKKLEEEEAAKAKSQKKKKKGKKKKKKSKKSSDSAKDEL